MQLQRGYSHQGPFRPKLKLPKPMTGEDIEHGWEVASVLKRQGHLDVGGAPGFNAAWVDYELSLLSTPGGAVFDRPPHRAEAGGPPVLAGRAIKADLIMRNTTDLTAVVGEVKVRRDKDPFSALVQLLAYIAHLSTQSQYRRLRDQLPQAHFPDSEVARLDGYLLFYRFGETNNRYLDQLMDQAEQAASALLGQPAIQRHVRRLVALDLDYDGSTLAGSLRWKG